jgi:hypothetical protein
LQELSNAEAQRCMCKQGMSSGVMMPQWAVHRTAAAAAAAACLEAAGAARPAQSSSSNWLPHACSKMPAALSQHAAASTHTQTASSSTQLWSTQLPNTRTTCSPNPGRMQRLSSAVAAAAVMPTAQLRSCEHLLAHSWLCHVWLLPVKRSGCHTHMHAHTCT